MKRILALPLTAIVVLAAACTSSGDSTTTDPRDTSPTDTGAPVTTDTGGDRDPGGTDTGPVGFAPAALRQFDECSTFLDYVHTEGADRVGPYGIGDNNFFGPVDVLADGRVDVVEAGSAPVAAPSIGAVPGALPNTSGDDSATSGEVDGSFSTTNVQVVGVDEPDIVKTDGDRILAITGGTLHYIDVAADGTTGATRGSIQLNDPTSVDQHDQAVRFSSGHEIFMVGNRAFVFAQGDSYYGGPIDGPFPVEGAPAGTAVVEPAVVEPAVVTPRATDPGVPTESIPEDGLFVDGDAEANFADSASAVVEIQEPQPEPPFDDEPLPIDPIPPIPAGYFGPTMLVFEIDLTNPDELTITNTLSIDGRYVSARAIGDTARIVVTSPPQDLGFLYPSNPGTEDKAKEVNQDIVRNSTVDDWIPNYTLTSDGASTTGQLVDCSGIHAPADFGGFDMLSILTLDLGSDLAAPSGTSAVMASGDTVYASADLLYVSTNIWNPVIDEQTRQWLDENYETAIHRFSIAGDGPASYEASGSIEGHLLNQFSMNDRDGVFYAATTKGAPWGDSSESQIVAMEANGDRLEQIGVVGGLGLGERIFSVRYVDNTAYVVTFRQTDPLYVIDIGDPRAMTVQGELKILGYSAYLHPISDTLVVGVGQDATDTGQTTGTKVSLFDVSDPANPREVDVWTLPNGYSDAEFDHRAFLYWEATSTAVLPLQSWNDQFAGAIVLHIDADGITEQGRITHTDEDTGTTGDTDCRVLTEDELGSENTGGEFFWVTQDGGQVQLCGSEDSGGATGLYCDTIPVEQLQVYPNSGEIDLDVTGADRVEICWPNWNGYEIAVQRTMVINDTLWTLSQGRLQANDLATLDRTAALAL